MQFLGGLAFGLVVWAGLLWGSIAIVDRGNAHNKFALALLWSGINLVATLSMQVMGFFGLFMLVAYGVLMLRVLTSQYELGIVRALAVIALMIAVPYFATPPLLRFVVVSELRAAIVLYGLPGGILATWWWSRRHPREP